MTKKINDCKKIYSVNPLYLLIDHVSGYIEEKGVKTLQMKMKSY